MNKLRQITQIMHQADTGIVPPVGDMEEANEIIGFSYGLHFDDAGQLKGPGPVNEAIAHHVVNDEVLRSKDMTLQEELAIAIEAREPRLANQIRSLPTVKKPGQAYNTHEILQQARPDLLERNVRSLGVVAFRHHLPRARAQVAKAGFDVASTDMSGVGDFDPASAQDWIRSKDVWIKRERKVIVAFALLGRL